jgi:uncharacterized protein YacL
MYTFNKIILSVFIGLTSFAILFQNTGELLQTSIYAGIATLLCVLLIFIGETYIRFENAEKAFCIGLGILFGLGISKLILSLVNDSKNPGLNLIIGLLFSYIGARVGNEFSKKPGLSIFGGGNQQTGVRPFSIGLEKTEENREKILDTSVVIDGRILDIADTHFIDGPLILPNFVLREIQLISDSSDPIKRARGRRGLDMLNKLQRKGTIEVKITYTDYTDTREVDAKLIKLARDTGGKLVTNDFNLNKVAELQGVKVLNLNNLANALKPVVLPGEEIAIQVIKEGKDENQGIGYLEDGTMVVIENGGHLVGKDVKVSVTSIIQTAAGKMIFTKAIK